MGTYDISKINNWFNDFTSARNKFNNKYCSDFTNSYIRNCNDSAVINMYNKLNQHYEKIKRINGRVNNIWDDFLFDVQAIDNRLAGQHVNARDSLISSKLSKIQNLEEYESDLNTKISSLSAKVGIVDKIGWSEDKTISENLDVLESTAAVITTSVISGVWKLSENIIDGALWLGTVVATSYFSMCGFDELASSVQNKMMDVIGFDVMGKANELFYENTSIGEKINEKSLIKYDSDVAQSIQNDSTKVTEIAVATGLTVATGGMAAPLSALIVAGTGFAIGAGAKAEENFSKEDRDFYGDFIEIGFAGSIKAVEFYSEGQMVSGYFKTIGSIKSAGGIKSFLSFMKTAFSSGKSGMSAKGLLKGGIKATLKDVDTYMDSIGAAFNNITYDNENGIEINLKGLIKETASNFAMNCVFGFIGNTLESGLKKITEDLNPKNIEVSSNSKDIDTNINTNSMKNVETSEHIVNDFDPQIENSNERFKNAIKFDNDMDIAIYFDDSKQYLYKKLLEGVDANDAECIKKLKEINAPYAKNRNFKVCPSADLNEKELFNFLNQNGHLSQNDIDIYGKLKSFDGYSKREKAVIFCFTKWSGPNLSAYNRHTNINYNGTIIEGTDSKALLDNTNLGIRIFNKFYKTDIPEFKSMDEFNSVMDGIVSKQKLKTDIIVNRTVDDLYFDGTKLDLDKLKPGDVFNDPAHVSTSARKVGFQKNSKRKVQLEIFAKQGTPAAYIESFTGVSGYSQQEILFGRNSSYKIIGYPKIDADGVYHIKVELLENNKYIPDVKNTFESNYAKFFNKTHKGKKKVSQIIKSMQQNGLMERYNKAVDDMIEKGLYDGPKAIAEHDLTHVKNVLLYAMNMGNDLKISNEEMSMLVDIVKYHDVGVVNARTHKNHAVLSAEKMGKILAGKYDNNNLKKMQAMVEFHEECDIRKLDTGEYVSDDSALKRICNKYGITEKSDIEQIKHLGSILKDADALDRTRFPGNIDINYFRNKEIALEYLNASYDIRESISSTDLFKRLNSGNYADEVINEVIMLVNKGYPDAIIDFGLKYYKQKNCTSITEYVEKIMRTTR